MLTFVTQTVGLILAGAATVALLANRERLIAGAQSGYTALLFRVTYPTLHTRYQGRHRGHGRRWGPYVASPRDELRPAM